MRKIIVEAEVSVDGAMGGENEDFWKQVFPYHSPDVAEYLDDLLFTPDALLMGKKTYEFFAMVWQLPHTTIVSGTEPPGRCAPVKGKVRTVRLPLKSVFIYPRMPSAVRQD